MTRAVLDTNVIISAQFWAGVPGQIYTAAVSQQFVLVSSEAQIVEIMRVLAYPKFARALTAIGKTADLLVSEFRVLAELVEPAEIPATTIRDQEDIPILACAAGGGADYIVTGDNDLLTLNSYQEVLIVAPAHFLEIIRPQQNQSSSQAD